jgi:hypothetical protein
VNQQGDKLLKSGGITESTNDRQDKASADSMELYRRTERREQLSAFFDVRLVVDRAPVDVLLKS